MPQPNNKKRRERTGGLGSIEQFTKLGQIVEEGSQITPVSPQNMKGHITAPSFAVGPGKHDPNNIKVAKGSIQQLNEFATNMTSVVDAQAKYKKVEEQRRIKQDEDKQIEAMNKLLGLENDWEEGRNNTLLKRTKEARNYLTPDRLNEVTKSNPQTGDDEIDFSMLTNTEILSISQGVDFRSLEGKGAAEIAKMLDALPIEWNFKKQRQILTSNWKTLETQMQTSRGSAEYYKGLNSLNSHMNELTASEYRADLIEIVNMLDADPNITLEEADEIIDNWNEAVYINNPELRGSGVYQQTIENIAGNAHTTISRSRIKAVTDWYDEIKEEGVIDLFIMQVKEHFKNGSIPIPEDVTWNVEDMPASYLTDFVVDSLLGTREDGPDFLNPEIIQDMMRGLGLGDNTIGFDSESAVIQSFVRDKIFPIVSERFAVERDLNTQIRRQHKLIMDEDSIARGDVVDIDDFYPSKGSQEDLSLYIKTITNIIHPRILGGFDNRAISIATNPEGNKETKLLEGYKVLSKNNFIDIFTAYHDRLGTFDNIKDPEERTKSIRDQALAQREKALEKFETQVIQFEKDASLTRFNAHLESSMLLGYLTNVDGYSYFQALVTNKSLDDSLDGIIQNTKNIESYRNTGEYNSSITYDYMHPGNLTDKEQEDIGDPTLLNDHLGIIKKTWKDQNGLTHVEYERIDPADPIGVTVHNMFKTVMNTVAEAGGSEDAGGVDTLNGLGTTSGQKNILENIIAAISREEDTRQRTPDTPNAIENAAKVLGEVEYEKYKNYSLLMHNVNTTGKLDNTVKDALLKSIQDPKMFHPLIQWMYLTDDNGKYHIHEASRRSLIKNLTTNENNADYRKLGWIIYDLDNKLTTQIGNLPSDPEERAQALGMMSGELSLDENMVTLLNDAITYAGIREKTRVKGFSKEVDKFLADPDYEGDMNIDEAAESLIGVLSSGGYLEATREEGSRWSDSNQLAMYPYYSKVVSTSLGPQQFDPNSYGDFMQDMMFRYLEYRFQHPVDPDTGESEDLSLNDFWNNTLSDEFAAGEWSIYIDDSFGANGRVYFTKDTEGALEGPTTPMRAWFSTASKYVITDNFDTNSMLYDTSSSIDLTSPKAVDNMYSAIRLVMDDYLIKEDGSFLADSEFFRGKWIAHPTVQEFYNTTRELRESSPDYTEEHEYKRVVENLANAIHLGEIPIPGEMDTEGNWISHPLTHTPTSVSSNSKAYSYKNAVHDYINIAGSFPSQEVYSMIGNQLKTRADIAIWALNSHRASDSIKYPSEFARQEMINLDQVSIHPNPEDFTHAELGIFRDSFGGERRDTETKLSHQIRKSQLDQYFNLYGDGYPVQLRLSMPDGTPIDDFPTLYVRNIYRDIDGRWVNEQTRSPAFVINQNNMDGAITREKIKNQKGKAFRLVSKDSPDFEINIVFPDNVHNEVRGEIEEKGMRVKWDWNPMQRGVAPFITAKKISGDLRGGEFVLPYTFSPFIQERLTSDLK